MEASWQGRAAFAEYAEAIGIATIDIIVVYLEKTTDQITAVYTRGIEDVEEIDYETTPCFLQALGRDAGGILVKLGPEREAVNLDQLLRQ